MCDCFSKRPDMVTFSAVENGHVECLILAHKQNYPMNDEQLCAFAAENDDFFTKMVVRGMNGHVHVQHIIV